MKNDVTNKRDTMESFLDEGMVLVQLDSRVDGVEVPDHLKGDPTLRLNISGRFGLPLDVDDWGIRATLTFQGDPFECKLPWKAVYIVISHVTGEPCLFPSDVPPEYVSEALGHLKSTGVATAAAKQAPVAKPEEAQEAEEPVRNHLRLIPLIPLIEETEDTTQAQTEATEALPQEASDNTEPDTDPEPDDPAPNPPKKPFLSVVK